MKEKLGKSAVELLKWTHVLKTEDRNRTQLSLQHSLQQFKEFWLQGVQTS